MSKRDTRGIDTNGSRFVRLYYKADGTPIRRKEPKERMSKKERRRKRREEKGD
jgi:hypothetical protein